MDDLRLIENIQSKKVIKITFELKKKINGISMALKNPFVLCLSWEILLSGGSFF